MENENTIREELWNLTSEWVDNVENVYKAHIAVKETLRALVLSGIMVISFVALVAMSFFYIDDLIQLSENLRILTIVALEVLFLFIAAFFVVSYQNRRRKFRESRHELAKVFHISEELFQMMISTEEEMKGDKYRYLVNHVRVLQIKHLLNNVEREISSSHFRGVFLE